VDDLEDQTPDATLLQRLREGDREAAVDLWTRHYPSVLMAARRVTRQPRDAEEIASDAFSGMLSALSSGSGPTTSVRAYLVTSVRNLAASRATRSSAGDVMTDDVALFDKPTADTTAHMSELQLVRVAFAELPQRWQIVLWRTAVDKDSNIEVGRAMGLSPNGVAALAKRARRGFRLAYLRAHLSDRGVEARCKPFIDGLADLSISEAGIPPELMAHVASCVACTRRLDELRAVNLHFAGVLGPAVLGLVPSKFVLVAGAGAVGTAGVGGAAGASSTATPAGGSANVLGFRPGARWALGSAALAAAAVAILMASRPEISNPPPVAQTLATSQQPSATPSTSTTTTRAAVSTPSVTTTARPPRTAPTVGPSTSAPTSPRTTSAPPPAPPSTTIPPRTTPLQVDLSVMGARSDTSIVVSAAAQGIDGPLRLTLRLPDGVTLAGAPAGDWRSCTQDHDVVNCTTSTAGGQRWSGTLHTTWPDAARGRVRATVEGTYATGSAAGGSVGTTWPP
jgi:RNA polymerase sigma factor (sigma-70 family)